MRIRVVPLQQDVVKHARPALVALFGAVGLSAVDRLRERCAPAARASDRA